MFRRRKSEREEARESFKQEALASWAAYQETGRHLTAQETRTWLNSWGTDAQERFSSATTDSYSFRLVLMKRPIQKKIGLFGVRIPRWKN